MNQPKPAMRTRAIAAVAAMSLLGLTSGCVSATNVAIGVVKAQSAATSPVSTPSASASTSTAPDATPAPQQSSRSATDNDLYSIDYSAVQKCEGFKQRTNVPMEERVAYLQSVVDCLTETNKPVLAAKGIDLPSPKVFLYGARDGACLDSQQDFVAFYCPADMSIEYKITNDSAPDMVFDTVVMAHEYAHHLQYVTGILDDADENYAATQEGEGMRRVELQAECMANVAVTADWSPVKLSASKIDAKVYAGGESGDGAATHGTADARRKWAKSGRANKPQTWSVCNTWTVPANEVE